ncbi:MAG: DUF4097 family beta strand repeat-containing protein [Lachnospiraceae bacterium]|nr:DUF4097 family beta strand repeat-containing protein [Lachnospiraceae bacterium]
MNRQEYMDKLSKALESFDSDIREEILGDYEEHFTDGLANGKSEDQIIEELGSIEDLVKELKGLKEEERKDQREFIEKEAKKTFEAISKAFAGFLGTMAAGVTNGAEKFTGGAGDCANNIMDGLSGMMDKVAEGLDKASGGLSDGFGKAADELGKAADVVANKTAKFAQDVADSYKSARNTQPETADEEESEEDDKSNLCASFKDCTEVIAECDSADIVVEQWSGDEVKFECEYDATPSQRLAYTIDYRAEDGKAYATIKKKETVTGFFKQVHGPEQLTITIPETITRMKLSTLAGDIECTEITSRRLDLNTMSGDIDLNNLNVQDIYANTMSGDIEGSDIRASIVDFKSMSGDVEFEGIAGNGHFASTSGDVNATVTEGRKVKATSISGDVDVVLQGVDGYTAEVDSKSGSIDLYFDDGEEAHEDVRRGSYTFGDGSVEVTANSVSGDVKVES